MSDPAESALDGQLGILDLLWDQRPRGTRGPKPAHNLEHIAQAAMDIADRDGLAALSMQRVAGELDFTKMALYRYVASKDELYAILIEAAVGEPPDLRAVDGGWLPKIEEWARLLRESWQRHPWLPTVTMGSRVMGPREVGWTESAVGALAGSGLSPAEQRDAVRTLSGHIRNTQSTSSAGTQPWTTDPQLNDRMQQLLHEHSDRFPALTAGAARTAGASADNGWQFGLRCILDGLALRIEARSGSVARTSEQPYATGADVSDVPGSAS